MHKYKRQMRSTIREVRRDNAFIARQKLADVKSRCVVRESLVKLLYALGEASVFGGSWFLLFIVMEFNACGSRKECCKYIVKLNR